MYVFLDSSIVYCTSYEPPICFASCTVIIPGSLCLSFCLAPCISLFFALSFTCASSLSLSCPPSRSLCISLCLSTSLFISLPLTPSLVCMCQALVDSSSHSILFVVLVSLVLLCTYPSHSRVLCSPLVHCISLDLFRALYASCFVSFWRAQALSIPHFLSQSLSPYLSCSLSVCIACTRALSLSLSLTHTYTHTRAHTHTRTHNQRYTVPTAT